MMRLLVMFALAATAATATAQIAKPTPPRFVGGRQVVETPVPTPAEMMMQPQAPSVMQPAQPGPAPDAPAMLDTRQPEPSRGERAAERPATQTPKEPEAEQRTTTRKAPSDDEEKKPVRKETKKSDKKDDESSKDANVTVAAVDEATTAVKTFLRLSNEGMYSAAQKMLTPHLQSYFDHEISAATGGLKAVADQITKDGRIRLVYFADWRGRGEGGRLNVDLTYNMGTEEAPRMVLERRTFEVQKVNGKWYVVIPVVAEATNAMINGPAEEVPTPAATPAPPEAMPEATPAPPPADATPADPTPAAPATTPQGADASHPTAAAAPPATPEAVAAASAPAAKDRRTTSSALDGLPW